MMYLLDYENYPNILSDGLQAHTSSVIDCRDKRSRSDRLLLTLVTMGNQGTIPLCCLACVAAQPSNVLRDTIPDII